MNVLVVTADPLPHRAAAPALAKRYVAGLQAQGSIELEWADLNVEGFDPRMQAADLAFYRGEGPLPAGIREEQLRIERADLILLTFPVYWWSVPALLKGWIDRVFTKGWAFETKDGQSALAGKAFRLIATAGAGASLYQRRGYRSALTTQLEEGILRFSGVSDIATHLFFDAERQEQAARERALTQAETLGRAPAQPQRLHVAA